MADPKLAYFRSLFGSDFRALLRFADLWNSGQSFVWLISHVYEGRYYHSNVCGTFLWRLFGTIGSEASGDYLVPRLQVELNYLGSGWPVIFIAFV